MSYQDYSDANSLHFYGQYNHEKFIHDCGSQTSLESQLLTTPSTDFVHNIQTQIEMVRWNKQVWPLSINYKEYNNALLCSPYTTYIQYPRELIKKFDPYWIKMLLGTSSFLLNGIGKASKINQVVQVNNDFNTIIRYEKQLEQILPELTQELITRHPLHTVWFSRLNEELDQALIQKLRQLNYIVFYDRNVHLFFPENDFLQHSNNQQDLELLANSHYVVLPHEEITDKDIPRIFQLYQDLFLKKHSKYNPQYTLKYFQEAILNRWHEYQILRNPHGKIDGFISWFKRDNTLLCGPIGYDLAIPQIMGLYRMMFSLCLQQADKQQLIFNIGGGNDRFKINRGSIPTLEYTAVYCQHLPYYRQLPWQIIKWATRTFLPKLFALKVF